MPKFSPTRRQPERIHDAEHKAHRALPAHEAGRCGIDVGGDLADGLDMVARNAAVDLCDHAVPVEQHVERHDRGDDEQAGKAENSGAAGTPDRLEQRRNETDTRASSSEFSPSRRLPASTPKRCFSHCGSKLVISACNWVRYSGSLLDEIGELRGKHRDQDHQRQSEYDDEGDQDQEGRHPPRDRPSALQPVGNRIEEIGQRHSRHEGQQNIAENDRGTAPRSARRRIRPESELTAKRSSRWRQSAISVVRRGSLPSPYAVHVPQPSDEIGCGGSYGQEAGQDI